MRTVIIRIPKRIDAALQSTWQARALAIVDAIILNLIILTLGRLAIGELPVAKIGGDDQAIGYAPVILVTALAGLLAWGLLALLERVTTRAATVWTGIAVGVFLVSLLGPIGNGVDTSSTVVLAMLHLGAATTLIPLLRRSATIAAQGNADSFVQRGASRVPHAAA